MMKVENSLVLEAANRLSNLGQNHLSEPLFEVYNSQKDLKPESTTLAEKYPKYWKHLPDEWAAVDVYRVCQLFPVDDASGRINHARKKLLVPGVRTGGKSMQKDIQEAIDTLQSWLNDNPEKPA